ncbi:hypothetical protein ACWEO2_32260 [Nocardia sp. NPDC004278]
MIEGGGGRAPGFIAVVGLVLYRDASTGHHNRKSLFTKTFRHISTNARSPATGPPDSSMTKGTWGAAGNIVRFAELKALAAGTRA